MQKKCILIMVLFCLASLLSAQSLYSTDYKETQLANNQEPTPVVTQNVPVVKAGKPIQDYTTTGVPVFQEDVMGKYGFLGFTLVTCLGLVVFVVKKDRETMGDLVDSLNATAKEIAENTSQVKLLASSVQAEIRQLSSNINTRLDALERSVERKET